MTAGRITKIVTSFGATWGRVQPHGESRELFFNLESLARPADFNEMKEGQEVEFDEEADRANGARAVHLVNKSLPNTPQSGREAVRGAAAQGP